jgi:uncharacterized protein
MAFRSSGWINRQRVPSATLRFRDQGGETRALLLFSGLYVLAACATGLAIQRAPLPLWGASDFLQDFWYAVVFKIGLLLVVPIALLARWDYAPQDLLYGWRATPRALAVVLLVYALGLSVNLGGERTTQLLGAIDQGPPFEVAARLGLGVALAFLQAGIPEELVFRGMLQTRLEASWGRLIAIAVTLVLFVAWHLPTRYLLANGVEGQAGDFGSVLLGTGAPVAVVGLVLGLAWDRWRNLPALIALHAGIDTLPIVSSMMRVPPR